MKQFNLEEYLKNPSKKVITRDGNSVRIVCTDRKHPTRPIIALVQIDKCKEAYSSYTEDGSWVDSTSSPDDLFFASVKKSGWINLYRVDSITTLGAQVYNTEEEAKSVARNEFSYISTIKIEWEE